MNTKINKSIALIFSFALILSLLLTSVDFWCFNRSFYKGQYKNLNTAEYIGMSSDSLSEATDVLLDYLKDRDLTLDVEANIKGVNRQVFNQRERDHMVDVRELYLNAMFVRNACLVLSAIALIYLIFNNSLSLLFNEYKKALCAFGLFFVLIGIFCLIDFDTFWYNFHMIFFSNDLWLLNPRTDILIMMVPEEFFFNLVIRIVLTAIVSIVALYCVLKYLNRKENIIND